MNKVKRLIIFETVLHLRDSDLFRILGLKFRVYILVIVGITVSATVFNLGCSIPKPLLAEEDRYFAPLDTLPKNSGNKSFDFNIERLRFVHELALRDHVIDSLRRDNRFMMDHIEQMEKKAATPPPPMVTTAPRTTELVLEKGKNIILQGVTFNKGKATLAKSSDATLKKAYYAMILHLEAAVEIAGYTDNQGKPDANDKLSMKRAQAVREWLMKKGIDPKRLTVKGLGAADPLATNDTPEGRAKNRRIEFHVK